MDNKLDSLVKNALAEAAKNIRPEEDSFDKIREEIKAGGGKKKRRKYYVLSIGPRKSVSLFVCFLAACTALLFASSSQARVLASQAFTSIKTIFVLEKEGDGMQIVEKPTNEVLLTNCVTRTTLLSDEELSERLGFRVRFPESLGGSSGGASNAASGMVAINASGNIPDTTAGNAGNDSSSGSGGNAADHSADDSYKLDGKSLGVVLKKQLDYDTVQSLESEMFRAIEDDKAFEGLAPYSPYRDTTGAYKKADGSVIFINASRLYEKISRYTEASSNQGATLKKVKVGDSDGYWAVSPVPLYPVIVENGIGKSDLSVKPVIKESCSLYWEKSGTVFILSTYRFTRLNMEEAVKIAEEFMKSNG